MARQRGTGRDDLSIDFVSGKNNPDPTKMPIEQQDCAAVLDDWVNRVANLPNEIAFMQEEIAEKDKEMHGLLVEINTMDRKIQGWVQKTPNAPYPREEEYSKKIKAKYDKIELLQAEKIALARKTERVIDKHTTHLDMQIKQLQDRGEFPTDPDIPSLLRPQIQARPARPEPTVAAIPLNTPNYPAGVPPRHPNQHPMKPLPAQVQSHHVSGGTSSAPASPAGLLKEQSRQRDAAMAAQAIKRQKLTGGVGITTNSSGLVRHSSLTPGTPRAGTPSGGRAGSAGPRASQKGLPHKKVAPQGSKQSGVPRKSKPGKSNLSRVKRTGNKHSSNDSDLSDGESGSGEDDDEAVTPPANNADGDDDMIDIDDDEGGDDKKYCTCQNVSFGDMVACDNESCPYEWFHWSCVGLKSEPVGTWICPVCTKNMKK
ncbi:Chromatin modification-related YNG2 [Hyphodiscus hymeniophilus]|uniref:Chromatin modification-related protein n=1 Tax=Hyphodiscus hymeniophilus TaxID=353542 RepID=A0A9P6VMG1_9HELO|nr:Chromatin modification-related YNG2 [Hyphodiscus hymeniophilus]